MKALSVENYQTTQKESLKAQSLAEWSVSACMNSAVTILTKPDRITAEELIKARDMLDKAILSAVERDALAKVNYKIADRKSTRLNSSHVSISYAVFCLKQ